MSTISPAQLSTLKNDILVNANTINFGGNDVLIKDLPNNGDANHEISIWYNQTATPSYWIWRSSVTRADVYHLASPAGTFWDWGTFKTQQLPEQNCWTQMFMGDAAPFQNLSLRNGVFAIFAGSAPQNTQRAHIFAVGRRLAKRFEKLLAVAPQNSGGITVGPNNGNTVTDTLGATTNPALNTVDGILTTLTGYNITDARNS